MFTCPSLTTYWIMHKNIVWIVTMIGLFSLLLFLQNRGREDGRTSTTLPPDVGDTGMDENRESISLSLLPVESATGDFGAQFSDSNSRDQTLSEFTVDEGLVELKEKLARAFASGNQAQRYTAISEIAEYLAVNDPDGAVEFFRNLPEAEDDREISPGQIFLKSLSIKLAELDPTGTVSILEKFPRKDRAYAYSYFAKQWMKDDIDAAMSWFDQLDGNSPAREGATLGAVVELRDSDPSNIGAAWARKMLESEYPVDAYQDHLIMLWSRSDVEGLYNWAADLTDQRVRDSVYLTIAQTMSGDDPETASNWALQLPGRTLQKEALRSTVQQWAGGDPESAANWVVSLNDAGMRDDSLDIVTHDWKINDYEQAREWIIMSTLPESVKERLLDD